MPQWKNEYTDRLIKAITKIQTEEEAYHNLHVQTSEYKADITLQLLSDRENLQTMANFASKLYDDGADFGLLFDSFRSIGLIESIAILMPDGTVVNKSGSNIKIEGIDFEQELKRGKKGDGVYNENGVDCTVEQLNSKAFYTETLGWSEDVWDFSELDVENRKYPILK